MPEPYADGHSGPGPDAPEGGAPGRRRGVLPLALVGVAVALSVVLTTGLITNPAGPLPGAPSPAPSLSPSDSPVASAAPPATLASAGLIAVVDASGALTTMNERGGSVASHAVPGVSFASPAWSPDGSRIAVIGSTADDTSIYVFSVQRDGTSGGDGRAKPVVIYRSPDRPPFYLSWTPDGRRVGFLATEPVGISLRIAPADGTAPLDGSGQGTVIRRGAPLYFDWEGADRLLLHVGSGTSAFVGEVGLDGASVAPAVPRTGDFRAASASRDGRYLAYVSSMTGSSGEIVVASRDGSSRHGLAVFGPAAFLFDPAGDSLASIAADSPAAGASGFPLGPLRVIDAATGAVRTLLEGSVIAFFWAPDGRTIAALRLARPADQAADAIPAIVTAASAGQVAAATPSPAVEVRLTFIDVATSAVRSERVVRPARDFVDRILPYFDQYALSHRIWAPDSSSVVLPLVDASGRAQLVVVPADATASRVVADGVSGFWSP